MRANVVGVVRLSGIGKESGKPYDFAQVLYLRPIEVSASEKFTLQGYGFEVGKLDLDIDALPQFAQVKFPAQLDLVVDNVPGRSGLRAVISGINGVKAAAA